MLTYVVLFLIFCSYSWRRISSAIVVADVGPGGQPPQIFLQIAEISFFRIKLFDMFLNSWYSPHISLFKACLCFRHWSFFHKKFFRTFAIFHEFNSASIMQYSKLWLLFCMGALVGHLVFRNYDIGLSLDWIMPQFSDILKVSWK